MIARRALLALFLAPLHMAVSATPTGAVVLRGRLDATQDESVEGTFTLTAANLDQPIELHVGAESYLQQFLDGCLNHDLTLTINPS